MAVSYVGTNVVGTGTTSATCDLTTGWTAAPTTGDMLVCAAGWGNSTNTAPATPTGWTAPANNSWVGGTGSWGSNTGSRGISLFYKIYDSGTDTAVAISNNVGAGDTCEIRVSAYSKSIGSWVTPVCTGATDTAADTSWSITGASNIGYTTGDHVMAACAYVDNTATLGTSTVTWTGVTMTGGFTAHMNTATLLGNDMRLVAIRQSSNSPTGTASAAPVWTATATGTPAGAGVFIRLRDGAIVPRGSTLPSVQVMRSFTR